MSFKSRIEIEEETLTVSIYAGDTKVVHQPRSPSGVSWSSREEAEAWASARLNEGVTVLGWPSND